MARRLYILSGKLTQQCENFEEWSRLFGIDDRHVAQTIIGTTLVSTVFIGIDHSFGQGPPLLFETLTFYKNGSNGDICQRYSTWEEAERGHAQVCADLQKALKTLQAPE